MDRGEQATSHAGYNLYTADHGGRRFLFRMRRQPEGFSYYNRLPSAIARRRMMPLGPPQPTQSAAIANDDGSTGRSSKRARVAEAAIQGLPEVKPKLKLAQPPDQCAVCLTDFDVDDNLRAMPCAHAFHEQCIFRWLRRNAACPLCRHELPTQNQDDDETALNVPAPHDP